VNARTFRFPGDPDALALALARASRATVVARDLINAMPSSPMASRASIRFGVAVWIIVARDHRARAEDR
jgi:hypothetical protein